MKRTSKSPVYGRHLSGQARTRFNGETRYLGPYGSEESHAAYAELLQDGQRMQERAPTVLTIRALAVLFLRHAGQHYRTSRGEPTGEAQNYRDALKPLIALYAGLPSGHLTQRWEIHVYLVAALLLPSDPQQEPAIR